MKYSSVSPSVALGTLLAAGGGGWTAGAEAALAEFGEGLPVSEGADGPEAGA